MQIHADYVRTLTLYMKDEEKFSVNTYNNRSYCYVVDKYISKSVQKMCGHLGMRQFVWLVTMSLIILYIVKPYIKLVIVFICTNFGLCQSFR